MLPPNWAPMAGSYEQELGDLDNDDDLDIYGLNWSFGDDEDLRNNGDGTFAAPTVILQAQNRQFEADFVDYDADGALDVFLVSENGPELLYHNLGAGGGFALAATTNELPAVAASGEGSDACDVDLDGDADLLIATGLGEPDRLFENVTQVADAFAPRIPKLEQAPDRTFSSVPTVVRAHVLDNEPWYGTAVESIVLETSVNGGPFTGAPMRWSGGQVFRGEIPGQLVGTIGYRVAATDEHGNGGVSATKSYVATCSGSIASYCTAKTNSLGCLPNMTAVGTPSASAGSGFVLGAEQVLAGKTGWVFYSIQGPGGGPFQGGYLCATPPTKRTPVQTAGSSGVPPCIGTYGFDFNVRIASGIDPTLVAGRQVWTQYWTRDGGVPSGTGLTDAMTFVICP